MTALSRTKANLRGIASLLWGWIIATGSLTLLCALSTLMNQLWTPFVGLALFLVLRHYVQSKRYTATEAPSGCYLIIVVAAQAVLISSVVMLLLNLVQTNTVNALLGADRHFPVVSTLIVAPVTLLVTAVYRVRHGLTAQCRSCRFRQDFDCAHSFLGELYRVEVVRQLYVMMAFSLLIALAAYLHFFWRFVAVNINRMDTLVFSGVPTLAFALEVVAAYLQYLAVRRFYLRKIDPTKVTQAEFSVLRFIVVNEQNILLVRGDDGRFDTPAALRVERSDMVRTPRAKAMFVEQTALRGCSVRFLYGSPNFQAECNVLHYIAVAHTADIPAGLDAQWVDLDALQQMIARGEVAPRLVSELKRIYLVGRTWKTYHRNGRRRYAIKDYRPTVRLVDVAAWDVEFDDPVWLQVATNNEDMPLFGLRRLWRKISASGE